MQKERLKKLLHLANSQENQSARDFTQARSDWEFNQQRLDDLRRFRDEYRPPQGSALQPGQFHSTRIFLSQLSDAIDQQEHQVTETLQKMNVERESWMGHRVKRRSMEKLSEKATAQIEINQQKREQNELDEFGQRRGTSSDLFF